MIPETLTTRDVADRLRCSPTKVRKVAASLGVGIDLRGRAGYRYTEADVEALWEAMRPQVVPERRRRRRSA